MSKEYWDKLHGLYADMQTGAGQAMNPAQQGPQAAQGIQPEQGGLPTQGYAQGGLVDSAEQRESGYSSGGSTPTQNPWYMDAAKGFAGNLVPAASQAATAMMIDRMFPSSQGKVSARDMRQPEMQQGAQMSLDRLKNLQANPNSFGLPGDPNDVNSPAGQRLYQIRKNQRSASAATGGLETGGHAIREQDAVNREIGNSYNTIENQGFSNLAQMTPQLQRDEQKAQVNPWAKLLTQALAPGVGAGAKAGLDALEKQWFI